MLTSPVSLDEALCEDELHLCDVPQEDPMTFEPTDEEQTQLRVSVGSP